MTKEPVTIDQEDDSNVSNLPVVHKQRLPKIVNELTPNKVVAQVKKIQQVMAKVMKPETHYGVIPGTQKPTLYKAGSEVLLTTFKIGVHPIIHDLSTDDAIRYRIECQGIHLPTGNIIGIGVGECSTDEDKYKWRKAVCEAEYDETDADRRRAQWKKKYNDPPYRILQVRTQPADLANTVLKMAKKRAQVDMTLTATAASDIFSQDLEDEPTARSERSESSAPQTTTPAQSTSQQPAGDKVSEGQARMLFAKCKTAGKEPAALCAAMGVDKLDNILKSKVNDAIAWAEQ